MTDKKGQTIDVEINEQEMRLDDPILHDSLTQDFSAEKLRLGMNKEMESMRHFDTYEEVMAEELTHDKKKGAIHTRWVNRWKGDEVRARLVAKGYKQKIEDKDGLRLDSTTPFAQVALAIRTITWFSHQTR